MKTSWHHEPARLTDDELLSRVGELAKRERTATAELIAHLVEVEARRLHLAAACCSLFAYCTRVLHFSEHEAYLRIEATRAARRFPILLEHLAAGELHLTAISLLRPVMTEANCEMLLAAARHKSRREIEEIVALHAGAPTAKPAPTRVVPVRMAAKTEDRKPSGATGALSLRFDEGQPEAESGREERRGDGPTPAVGSEPSLAYRLHVTLAAETQAKLDYVRELMRHQVPDGDAAVLLDRALDLLIEHAERRKFGKLKSTPSWIVRRTVTGTRSGPSSAAPVGRSRSG